jgi:hypothetical protein
MFVQLILIYMRSSLASAAKQVSDCQTELKAHTMAHYLEDEACAVT